MNTSSIPGCASTACVIMAGANTAVASWLLIGGAPAKESSAYSAGAVGCARAHLRSQPLLEEFAGKHAWA
jgi:hypothetical protein